MDNEIIIAIVAALVGGFITLVVTYLNNKSKIFELEYNYRKKLEERYLANAQVHLNDIYVPLYSKLNIIQHNWIELKESNNFQNLEKEIAELENFKKDLEDKGLTAFLTREIEVSFDKLLDFVSKSKDETKVRYGVIENYTILGQESTDYWVASKYINPKTIPIFRIFISLLDIYKKSYLNLFVYSGLIEYNIKIILDSAPLDSNDFNQQFLDFISGIKDEIKSITLGTK